MIHICTPFALNKDLATAYNEAFEQTTADWLFIMDYDVCFLHPLQIQEMYKAIENYPNVGVFLTYTNRISGLSQEQNFFGSPSDESDMKVWLQIAENQLNVTPLCSIVRRTDFSGFGMLISRKTWEKVPFERYMHKGGSIGVDTMWSRRVRAAQIPVMRINTVILWHSYRLLNGTQDKTHLI